MSEPVWKHGDIKLILRDDHTWVSKVNEPPSEFLCRILKDREKDPELWEQITGLELAEYEYDDENGSMSGYIYQEDLIEGTQEAWLQHCLQEAIRARGWHLYQIRNDDLPGLPCFADIIILGHGKEHDIHHEGEGDTEAEALGWAYLAAIHGEKA